MRSITNSLRLGLAGMLLAGSPSAYGNLPAQIPSKPVQTGQPMRIDAAALTADAAKAAETITQFVLKGGYVSGEIADKQAVEIKAVVAGWVDRKIKEGDAGRLAVAEMLTVIEATPESEMRKTLATNLSLWTGASVAATSNPGTFPKGQLKSTRFAEWTDAFLSDASAQSGTILRQTRTKEEVKTDVIKREDKPVVFAGGFGSDRPSAEEQAKEDYENLFIRGARSQAVFQDGDKTSRQISMRIVTTRGADGDLDYKVRIFDITNPGDVFYREFPVPSNGGERNNIALDDREAGHRTYKLTMTPQRDGTMTIVFGRQDSEGEGNIETSLHELYNLRAKQAVQFGDKRTINGLEYYVLSQPGEYSEKLFFPGEVKDRLGSKKIAELTPTHMSTLSKFNGRRNVPVSDKPDIGSFGGKPYHFEYVTITDPRHKHFPGYWEIMEGEGKKFVEPKTETKEEDKNPKPGPGGKTPEEMLAWFLSEGYYEVYEKPTKDSGGRAQVLKITKPKGEDWLKTQKDNEGNDEGHLAYARKYVLHIPKEKRVLNLPFSFGIRDSGKEHYQPGAVSVLDGQFLVTESDLGVLYMDLDKVYPKPGAKSNDPDGFVRVGEVGLGGDGVEDVKISDKRVLADALKRAGFGQSDIAKAVENFGKVTLKDAAKYAIMGNRKASLIVESGGAVTQFWPEIKENASTDGIPGENIKEGQPFAWAAGPDSPMRDEETWESHKIKAIKSVADAKLYESDGKGTADDPQKWYVKVQYKVGAATRRTPNLAVFGKGGKDQTLPEFPGVNEVGIAGLTNYAGGKPLGTAQVKIVASSDKKKGAYVVVFSTEQQVKDPKANCAGPIVWWGAGVTQEKAQKACETGNAADL